MDDSDQDFVDLCSKLLKRVRKNAGDTGVQRNANPKSSTQACGGDSSKRSNKKDVGSVCGRVVSATQSVSSSSGAAGDHWALSIIESDPKHPVLSGSVGRNSGDVAGPPGSADSGVLEANDNVERSLGAKDKVLLRMQQFKRVSPRKLMYNEKNQPTRTENDSVPQRPQRQDSPVPSTSGLHHVEPQDSDEALALRLQQELDREAAVGQAIDLADGGLFFCQLCHRNLSHMTPEGRAQHLNRCLDEIEGRAPPPPPSVPDCPICGKRFKSLKSRSAHLKRCSSDMGVSPADLLQALQRQAAEAQSDSAANPPAQTGGSKRKGPSVASGLPVRKKPRRKAQCLDEDTIVALALSSSLLEQEKERERQRVMERELQWETSAPHTSMTPLLKWRSDAGKARGKRKKVGIPHPPPLLLVQDAEMALRRLQERVASLLLHSRASSPPTPTRVPSSLPAWSGAAPLWQKSALRDGGPSCLSEFYTPELREFIVPLESTRTNSVSATKDRPDKSIDPAVREVTPLSVARRSILPSTSPALSTQGTGQLPVGSQTLNDLMELADEGMTLTQWGCDTLGPTKDLHLSGFVPEEPEQQADLCLSGFIPDSAHNYGQARRSGQPRADTQTGTQRTMVLSRLVSDLSSMVNNPQLSDIQLQVDSGEVFFAHSFMLYTRCPLLAQMVHDSGFGVQEEGMPAAQRVLLGEVPGQAVHALLQYLYTAHCPITLSLLPHVQELASRFDLAELQQMCQLHSGQTEIQGEGAREGESWEDCLGQEQQSGAEETQRDQAFLELLRSMWNEEDDEDDDGRGTDGGGDREMSLGEGGGADDVALGDREIHEEQMNEEEMEEIYEFAATQRKREEEKDSLEEGEGENEEGDLNVEVKEDQDVSKPNAMGPKGVSTGSKENSPHLSSQHNADPSLDRSYSQLFSDCWGVYEEDTSSPPPTSHLAKTRASHTQQHDSPRKPSSRGHTGVRLSDECCLQSSASEVIDLSISPPSSVSNLPIPGLSPDAVSDKGDGGHEGIEKDHVCLDVPKKVSKEQIFCREERLSPKRESQGPHSICVPLSPASPQSSKQPELIVLSDSSEEVELAAAAVSQLSPSPPSPNTNQNLQLYTRIRTRPNPEPNDPSLETSSSECGASAPVPASSTNQPGSISDALDQSPMDCSPEVSWLIPTTPVQPRKITSTSSTQTHSSMCRTQLFPKAGSSSSSSSSVFSSSSLKDRPQTSSNPHRVSTHIAQTECTVSRVKLDRSGSHRSSQNISHSPKRYNSSGRKDRDVGSSDRSPVFAVPPSQLGWLPHIPPQDASTKETPLHSHPQPYSSTPLHTDVHMPPALPAASPLLRDPDREGLSVQGRGPEKRGLGAPDLSISDPSDSKSPTPHNGSPRPHRDSRSLSYSMLSEFGFRKSPGSKRTERAGVKARGVRNEEGEGVVYVGVKGTGTEGGQEEATSSVKEENEEVEVSASSFCKSLTVMDEPPMAFDDSWGLDAGADGEGNRGVCFSLRLEDSGGASPPDHGLGGEEMARSSSPTTPPHPSAATHTIHPFKTHNRGGFTPSPPSKTHATRPSSSLSPTPKTHTHVGPSLSSSPPDRTTHAGHSTPEVIASLLDPKIWDDWEDEEEEEALPLSQRVNPVVPTQRVPQFKTPVLSRSKERGPLVPITPLPSYSDMDTPELKNKLNRFGVRPLPKRQMILKLKEIHHYTHQLSSSDSEDEAPTLGHTAQMDPLPTMAPSSRPVSCAQANKFKQPRIPSTVSPVKHDEEDAEPLSASQGSNTSTAASEDSERSNPELCLSDGESDSDGGVTASQAASCHKERLQAVRSFILSDPELYSQILQYQPLILSQLQARLKAAGIRLGAAKLLDYLDSQCITFTTAKPSHSANNRRRGRGRGAGKGAKAPGGGGVRGRKREAATSMD